MIVGIAVLLRVFIRSEFYQCLFFFYWDDHMTFPLFSVNVINCTICNDVLFFLYVMTFALLIFCLVFFFFQSSPEDMFTERKRERKRERIDVRKTSVSCLPLGIEPATQAGALTGNRTGNFSVHEMMHWSLSSRAGSLCTRVCEWCVSGNVFVKSWCQGYACQKIFPWYLIIFISPEEVR